MSRAAVNRELAERLGEIAQRQEIATDSKSIAAIVEAIIPALDGGGCAGTLTLYAEVESLARYIGEARAEIAAIRPEEIRDEHLRNASDELDAIVESTEHATNAILEAAEAIESIAATAPPPMNDAMTAAVTKIYEACNFQDVTGQRVTKVVKALKHIEVKVEGLLMTFGVGARPAAKPAAGAQDADAQLLHGPQLPANATSQDDIDRMLAG